MQEYDADHSAARLTYIFHKVSGILVIISLPSLREDEEIVHGDVALLLLVEHGQEQRDLTGGRGGGGGAQSVYSGYLILIIVALSQIKWSENIILDE
jgi:hypothetical protein